MSRNESSELQGRLSFINIDDKTRYNIRSAKAVIMARMPDALSEFYRRISENPATSKFFSGESQTTRAKTRQVGHWDRLSSGHIDEEYVKAVTTVGKIHATIGLEPRWYIGGYALLLEHLIVGLVEDAWVHLDDDKGFFARSDRKSASKRDALVNQLVALLKIALLDIDFSISVYLDAAEKARVQSEAEALAGERARIIATVGEAMKQVADGNLTYRMPDELPSEYNQLRDDFNAAVAALEHAMVSVSQTALAIKSSVTEVGHASSDLAERTEQQSSALQEAAATTEELAASVKANANSARDAESVASEAKAVAENGGAIVRDAIGSMSLIEEASGKISEITSVIEGIAFQTNLLALNAAVEAARAGEAGKGFAVVASEVRTLAQRSSEASKDINQLISSSAAQVTQGVRLVRSAGDALSDIVQASSKVAVAVAEISSASSEQASGIEDMTNTVAGMDGVTQQNAALAEQSAAAATALTEQVLELDRAISAFRVTHHPGGQVDDNAAGAAQASTVAGQPTSRHPLGGHGAYATRVRLRA